MHRRSTPAEQHLGDRLAALIDGELSHELRERVLAHLATCFSCKAEADAQRRVKSVFADIAPPAPSDGLLARLQGLAADSGSDNGSDNSGDNGSSGPGASSRPAGGRPSPWELSPLPSGRTLGQSGFRIHELERTGSRGRRFAFAAAGAFSLAALAIGGALSGESTANVTASAPDPGTGAVRVNSEDRGSRQAVAEGGRTSADGGRTRLLRSPGPSVAPVATTDFLSPLLGTAAVLTPPLVSPGVPGPTPGAPAGTPGSPAPSASLSVSPSAGPTGYQPLIGGTSGARTSATAPGASGVPRNR